MSMSKIYLYILRHQDIIVPDNEQDSVWGIYVEKTEVPLLVLYLVTYFNSFILGSRYGIVLYPYFKNAAWLLVVAGTRLFNIFGFKKKKKNSQFILKQDNKLIKAKSCMLFLELMQRLAII